MVIIVSQLILTAVVLVGFSMETLISHRSNRE